MVDVVFCRKIIKCYQKNTILMFGAKGTGKSSHIRHLIDVLSNFQTVIILDIVNNEEIYGDIPVITLEQLKRLKPKPLGKKAVFRIISDKYKGIFEEFSKLENTTIVLEDLTAILGGKEPPDYVKKVFTSSKALKNNIIAVFHSYEQTNVFYFGLSDIFVMHKTNENVDLYRKIPNPKKFKKKHKIVEANKSKYYYKTFTPDI